MTAPTGNGRVVATPKKTDAQRRKSAWIHGVVIGSVCALVIGVYAYIAPAPQMSSAPNAADQYYNSLVRGFRAGHLSLQKEVPRGLAELADPYNLPANTHYGVLDLSYYKGKLYFYFGVTPAVVWR